MAESKGKLKKLRKKAEAGTIMAREHYEACVAAGIRASAEVRVRRDEARGQSKHHLSVSVSEAVE
jgi:hypothetical protein